MALKITSLKNKMLETSDLCDTILYIANSVPTRGLTSFKRLSTKIKRGVTNATPKIMV